MAWGTEFKADIYLNRMSFNSILEINSKLKENDLWIKSNKDKIKMLCSSNVRDVVPEEWKDEPVEWLNIQCNDYINQIIEYEKENQLLELYKEYLENEGNTR